jgi:RNA polymerase sigma-70 factor, ECF subfamily
MSNFCLIPGHDGEPQPSSGTSRSLLERIRADDAAAWQRLVTLYAPLVCSWCRRWGLQDQDAADVLQEVFQAVVANIAGFRKGSGGGTFRGWLRTITDNKVRDLFRRLGREPRAVGGSEAQTRLAQVPMPPDHDASASAPEERGLLHRALEVIRGEFHERTWQAFWRTAIDGRPSADVATELSMNAGAVRVAKSRVLHRLREELGDLLE